MNGFVLNSDKLNTKLPIFELSHSSSKQLREIEGRPRLVGEETLADQAGLGSAIRRLGESQLTALSNQTKATISDESLQLPYYITQQWATMTHRQEISHRE